MSPTSEQLDNPQREKFAQLVASGIRPTQAYRDAYGESTKGDNKVISGARQHASRLMSFDDVKDRIRSLQSKSASGVVLTLSQKREFLHKLVTTAVGDIDETSPLCQSYKYSDTGREYKMPCKLRAMELDAKLAGELSDSPQLVATVVNLAVLLDGCPIPSRGEVIDLEASDPAE